MNEATITEEISRKWGWYLALGLVSVVLGFVALGATVFTTLVSVMFFGAILIVGGIVQAVQSFHTRKSGGFLLHLLMSILGIVVGVLMMANPGVSAISLTLLLASFFIVGGAFRSIAAVAMRPPSWGWALFSGLVTFLLGVLIWAQFPTSGLWVIGMFVGIDLIFSGWSLVMLSTAVRSVTRSVRETESRAA